MDTASTSKFLSLVLRHKPETIGISLDEHGWAEVDRLIAGIAKTREFHMGLLEEQTKSSVILLMRIRPESGQTKAIPSQWMCSWNVRSRQNSYGMGQGKNTWLLLKRPD